MGEFMGVLERVGEFWRDMERFGKFQRVLGEFSRVLERIHAFSFISNTFISNTRLKFALCERQILENIATQWS